MPICIYGVHTHICTMCVHTYIEYVSTCIDPYRADCHHFGMSEPDIPLLSQLREDIDSCSAMWAMYDEFSTQLRQLSEQDWLSFRYACTYVCTYVPKWPAHIYVHMCLHTYVQARVNVISVSVLNCNMLRMYSTGALTELCRYVRMCVLCITFVLYVCVCLFHFLSVLLSSLLSTYL